MLNWITKVTDKVSTRKGAWVTLIIWLVLMIGLSAGPQLSEYKVSNFQSLPDDAPSIIASEKVKELFPSDTGTPGILVFHNEQGVLNIDEVNQILTELDVDNVEGVETYLNPLTLPEQALSAFLSEDQTTLIAMYTLKQGLGNAAYSEINDYLSDKGNEVAEQLSSTSFYITGPAGIAGDTLKLFEKADFNLLIATILIILVLLIVIYRSPLLALIPLLATVIVYQVTNQTVALFGASGLEINNSTTSIMSILLFAAVIDYSLFVFSRYKETLVSYESKYESMKHAMRSTGKPVFFAGGTVFVSMIVLFIADFRDYQNFAPIFGTAMIIIMMASITLVPALFALFGRKAFWPLVPKQGETKHNEHRIWGKIAKAIVKHPWRYATIILVILLISAANVFNLKYEFNMVKGFPQDMASRIGYDIVEEKFNKGDLAQTTIILTSDTALDTDKINEFRNSLLAYEEVQSVRLSGQTEDELAAKLTLSLTLNPYSQEAIAFMEQLQVDTAQLLSTANLNGEVYYSGETAKLLDERNTNNSDIIKIVILEVLMIVILLFVLTRSYKMPIYMMLTILVSYVSALGLGLFLVDVLFGYDAISTRVPVYAFIFLVALGIDYNIILVSRFLEEVKTKTVKDALEIALRNTGGVISSAGIILAATFAALMTMPINDLFVFGFIVAIGIILDTFLVRGVLLPALILFFEKGRDKKLQKQS